MAKTVTLEEAVHLLDEDNYWRSFQVRWPDGLKSGAFRVEKFSIPKWDHGRLRIIRDEGMDRDPGHGNFTRLVEYVPGAGLEGAPRKRTWMSDTRAEIMEHSPAFNHMSRAEICGPIRLLVNGLGLAVVVQGALVHYKVDHIDVVESNQDVINMIAPLLPEDKVTVHHGDAFEKEWPPGTRWDVAWHDIWPTIDNHNLPGMRRLMKKYGKMSAWQGCWQMGGCLKMESYYRKMEQGTLDPYKAFLLAQGRIPL